MIEKVVFMNMCMISDNKGNVLALDKVGKNYSGTTFPGGHVEAHLNALSAIPVAYPELKIFLDNLFPISNTPFLHLMK